MVTQKAVKIIKILINCKFFQKVEPFFIIFNLFNYRKEKSNCKKIKKGEKFMKNKERKLTRIFTAIMAVLILLLSVPMSALASDSFAETENETGAEEIELQNDEIIVLKENEDLREANIKHYDLSNGISKAFSLTETEPNWF